MVRRDLQVLHWVKLSFVEVMKDIFEKSTFIVFMASSF